jgi:hypothetical protein
VAVLLACAVASAGTEVKEALAGIGPVELEAGSARVGLAHVSFSDVVVTTDGAVALVVAMVQADGTVRLAGGEPSLAYVGREAFRMERCAGRRWCLAPDALGGLRGVVAALAAAPRPAGARPVAWQVRVDRDRADAGEDYEAVEGGAPRRLRSTWALARAGKAWALSPAP